GGHVMGLHVSSPSMGNARARGPARSPSSRLPPPGGKSALMTMASLQSCVARLSLSSSCLLHEPTMADDERLASQRVRIESGEKHRRLGDVLDRGELAIYGFLQHDVFDHFLLCDS